MDKLKPCPFCGKRLEVVDRDVEPQGDSWYGRKDEIFVLCDCGACLFDGMFHEGFANNDRAISAWNTRSSDTTLKQSHEELVKALEPFKAIFDKATKCRHEEGSTCTWVIEYDDLYKANAAIQHAKELMEPKP